MQDMKTHYHSNISGGYRLLFCSGMAVSYTYTTDRLDDVTCKACKRKLVRQAKKAAA